MNEEQPAGQRRVLTRYGAEVRERLIRKQAQSGLTKRAFCAQRQIKLGTFYGWAKQERTKTRLPAFAQVDVSACTPARSEAGKPLRYIDQHVVTGRICKRTGK